MKWIQRSLGEWNLSHPGSGSGSGSGWTGICGQCIPQGMGCSCRGPSRRRGSCAASSWLLMLGALAVGCTAPVGVHRISVREEHEELTRNALTTQEPSDQAEIVLRRYNLVELYGEDPQLALSRLREVVVSGRGDSDELYALAELSYLYGAKADSKAYAMSAAVYAYAYLFPDDTGQRPDGIDPRYRWACDIYAEALTQALRAPGER